ncbi:MAG: TIGR03619 family F420-dependent LLM class oxidoreductase [Nitrospinota bacterium]|nr:TIGR03619 family F420-dependent LLM class oxidoreductase [Nitrospinota bacterium]
MAKVKFGISSSLHPEKIPAPEEIFNFAEQAEKNGYDSLWMGDHIAFHGHYTDSLTTLAAFAARTSRIIIGSAVFLIPLRRPAVAAKIAATVDFLSGGNRFIFGVGIGGEGEKEFELCGVPVRERGKRTDESIEIIKKLWTGSKVEHEGQFWNFSSVSQTPAPLTKGGPPIWVGGRSDAARKRAVMRGNGYISYLYSAERFKEGLTKMHDMAHKAGKILQIEEGLWTPAHHSFIYCNKDEKYALKSGIKNLSYRYNMDFNGIAEKYLIFGPPEKCIEDIEKFKHAGVKHFVFKHAGPPEEELEQLTLLSEEVIQRTKN